jgi:hypothetical protein
VHAIVEGGLEVLQNVHKADAMVCTSVSIGASPESQRFIASVYLNLTTWECRRLYGEDEQRGQHIDEAEMKAFNVIMEAIGRKLLPQNMNEELLSVMATSALFPNQMKLVLHEVAAHAPHLFKLGVRCCRPLICTGRSSEDG